MVRPEVVERKLSRAIAWLDDAEAKLSRPAADFLADLDAQDLASFHLFLAIQECIDLAAHWVADARWGSPDEASATFDLLARHGAIDHELAAKMRGAVGLRNRIAHGYSTIDQARIHGEYREGITTLRKFLAHVAEEVALPGSPEARFEQS
jgi:uncharacterized protein YutE (UPF0331/DUF86 family)